jgi:hypothetical protein
MAQGWDQTIEGMTQRTERAFRQDAELAMGADPIRAIVELVTNADDAYVQLDSNRKGSIRIEIQRRRGMPSSITVRDRAGGMTLADMEKRLGTEASRTSGFESALDVRGLLGRGAKDCAAFGTIAWESWTAKEVATWELQPTGRYRAYRRHRSAQDHFTKHGTVATLQVEKRFALKQHNALRESLTRHYELRPCLMDRRGRDVHLLDLNQDRDDHLVYEMPRGELVADTTLAVPGYPGETISVRLLKATENLDDGSDRDYWRHGLLIRSGRAAYDVFAGRFEREPWSQYLGWFFGEAEVPGLRRFIKDYDDRLEAGSDPFPNNPIRLVSRNRRGLVKSEDHPFIAAITKALEDFLQPHLDQLRRELDAAANNARLSKDTDRRLRELGRLLGRVFEEEVAAAFENRGQEDILGLQIIPEVQEIEPGTVARFSVRFAPPTAESDMAQLPTARMRVVNGNGYVLPSEMELTDRGSYYSRSFTVHELGEGDMSEIEVTVEGISKTCVLQCSPVAPGREIDRLQFEHSSYRVRDGGQRHLTILAPWELVADESTILTLALSGDPTISLVDDAQPFVYDYRQHCGIAYVTVRGRSVGSKARVSAGLGEQLAVAELEVTSAGASSNAVKIELIDEPFPQRALWADKVLKISAQDKSISRYLGAGSAGWPGQDAIAFRTMLAEIVGFHSIRRIVEFKYKSQNLSSLNLYREHLQLERKYLARIHAVLVDSNDIATQISEAMNELIPT